jgi:hypothetical protein
VRSLINKIDAQKICLFSQPKIMSWIMIKSNPFKNMKSDMAKIKSIVKELRHEMSEIESITFSGANNVSDWIKFDWPYAVIDIKARGIEFQVAFKMSWQA